MKFALALALLAPVTRAPAPTLDDRPTPRHHHGMAFDVARGRLVLFGGNVDGGIAYGHGTWTRDVDGWTRSRASDPLRVSSHTIAYHARAKRTILFGGFLPEGTLSGATWSWDGDAWTAVEGGGPSARHSAQMAYDPKHGRLVLFGGSGRGTDVLWEFDGEAWRRLEVDGDAPPPVMRAGFAYDPAAEALLLFGGHHDGVLGATWRLDGKRWTRLDVEGPPARANASMATDPARRRVVLFGGSDAERELLDDTWEWDGAKWSRVEVEGPAPAGRTQAAMAYDPVEERILLHGGRDGRRRAIDELWSYDGEAWKRLEP